MSPTTSINTHHRCSTAGQDKWSEGGGVPIGGPGLVSGHAYSLIAAKVLSNGQKLVQLRNPWGDFEWNGAWSGVLLFQFDSIDVLIDKSPLWTEHFKREVSFLDNPGDGLFYMAYEDFVKYFSGINVCRPFAGAHTIHPSHDTNNV